VADINDRLDRLQRREDFDRFGRPVRPASADTPVGPPISRPAGVDDRLGEVLDAVASVVRRHSGLSVMVALADGRAGRPVIRVTERDGGVETGVVVVGSGPPRVVEPVPQPAESRPPADFGPYDGLSTPAAAPARESVPGSDPVFEPALREDSRDSALRDGAFRDGALRDIEPVRDDLQPVRGPARSAAANGRHAAAREQPGRAGPSWHDALWSQESRDRFRQADQGRQSEQDRQQSREDQGPATISLPDDTSQVVSRLAQLLRDNPTLAASWSREAQE
jgi:hypothetical protein